MPTPVPHPRLAPPPSPSESTSTYPSQPLPAVAHIRPFYGPHLLTGHDYHATATHPPYHSPLFIHTPITTSTPPLLFPHLPHLHTSPPHPQQCSTGDPHFRSFNGRHFDFHGVGEFVLLDLERSGRSGPASVRVHACQQDAAPQWSGAAANSMLAVRTPLADLRITPRAPATVDVASTVSLAEAGISITEVLGERRADAATFNIELPSGISISVRSFGSRRGGMSAMFLHVFINLPDPAQAQPAGAFHGEGLCGWVSFDGASYAVGDAGDTDAHSLYNAWRVPAGNTLFDGACVDEGFFPSPCETEAAVLQVLEAKGITEEAERECSTVCPEMFRECLCDAAITGDVPSMVTAAREACGMEWAPPPPAMPSECCRPWMDAVCQGAAAWTSSKFTARAADMDGSLTPGLLHASDCLTRAAGLGWIVDAMSAACEPPRPPTRPLPSPDLCVPQPPPLLHPPHGLPGGHRPPPPQSRPPCCSPEAPRHSEAGLVPEYVCENGRHVAIRVFDAVLSGACMRGAQLMSSRPDSATWRCGGTTVPDTVVADIQAGLCGGTCTPPPRPPVPSTFDAPCEAGEVQGYVCAGTGVSVAVYTALVRDGGDVAVPAGNGTRLMRICGDEAVPAGVAAAVLRGVCEATCVLPPPPPSGSSECPGGLLPAPGIVDEYLCDGIHVPAEVYDAIHGAECVRAGSQEFGVWHCGGNMVEDVVVAAVRSGRCEAGCAQPPPPPPPSPPLLGECPGGGQPVPGVEGEHVCDGIHVSAGVYTAIHRGDCANLAPGGDPLWRCSGVIIDNLVYAAVLNGTCDASCPSPSPPPPARECPGGGQPAPGIAGEHVCAGIHIPSDLYILVLQDACAELSSNGDSLWMCGAILVENAVYVAVRDGSCETGCPTPSPAPPTPTGECPNGVQPAPGVDGEHVCAGVHVPSEVYDAVQQGACVNLASTARPLWRCEDVIIDNAVYVAVRDGSCETGCPTPSPAPPTPTGECPSGVQPAPGVDGEHVCAGVHVPSEVYDAVQQGACVNLASTARPLWRCEDVIIDNAVYVAVRDGSCETGCPTPSPAPPTPTGECPSGVQPAPGVDGEHVCAGIHVPSEVYDAVQQGACVRTTMGGRQMWRCGALWVEADIYAAVLSQECDVPCSHGKPPPQPAGGAGCAGGWTGPGIVPGQVIDEYICNGLHIPVAVYNAARQNGCTEDMVLNGQRMWLCLEDTVIEDQVIDEYICNGLHIPVAVYNDARQNGCTEDMGSGSGSRGQRW
ncbi:hypothetical protein CYMTET_42910, partial [Cymbomonas tetramitiformis]